MFLRGGRTLPLGAAEPSGRETQTVGIASGSTLVLYTDGLIERRTSPLDAGFRQLAATVRPELTDPEETCEAIVAGLLGEEQPADDVAILVMRTE